ncbi:MAG: valine--tRNA ligase [Gammaproteobacteria bacterium]
MEKTYDPKVIENRFRSFWEDNDFFSSNLNSHSSKSYCIMLPPPNVTGSLHMGHAFQHTIMDILTRYHRANGDQTLWQPGTDHAGIATQMVVERQLGMESKTRHDLGRDKFIERVWDWKESSGGTITSQMRRLGTSVDWSRERFTMDEGLSDAVQKVFIDLYNEGLIYRGKRLVNWDPVLHTAVSDLEVISTEEQGSLWHMRYPITDSTDYLVVATTRPETMLGDTAVAVHPEDERYSHLIGKTITLPLTDRIIPIIGDDYVDREFGTGCVKITPAHDFNDYEMGERHNLEKINIFTDDAKINDAVHSEYQGMDRFDARKAIIKDLEKLNLLEKIEPHKLMVPRGDRTNAVIEPYLTDQWFVKVEPLAKPAIDAVKNGDINFIPSNWSKTYFNWMENIEDWCISRQIWWGHRIPAWYDESGKVYVANNIEEAQELAGKDAILSQDQDVLDTWFSSALWPFSTLGWPENTKELETFYPTSVLVTGFDIIFFWVARMIMFGLKFAGDIPFKDIYITGLIRDSHGQKMSKSKGNVLDPIDLIDAIDLESLLEKRTQGMMQPEMAEKIKKQTASEFPDGIPSFGTDALRFTFAALASFGRDIKFDLKRVEGYRNFCNKLWNASRYVLMKLEGSELKGEGTLSTSDEWILSRLQGAKKSINKHLNEYRIDLMAQTIYDFVWHDFCDWYLELSKPLLNDPDTKNSTEITLIKVLEEIITLLHPITPFITEEIYQSIREISGSYESTLILKAFPTEDPELINSQSEKAVGFVQEFILSIRQIRGEMNISPNKTFKCFVNSNDSIDRLFIEENVILIKSLAKLEEIVFIDHEVSDSAMAIVNNTKLFVPIAGLIDVEQEVSRLEKEIEKNEKQRQQFANKLNNEKFVKGSPKQIVDVEKERLSAVETKLQELSIQLNKIKEL